MSQNNQPGKPPKEASHSYMLNANLVVKGQNKDGEQKMSRKQLESMPSGEGETLAGKSLAGFGDKVVHNTALEEMSQVQGEKAKQGKQEPNGSFLPSGYNDTLPSRANEKRTVNLGSLTVYQDLIYRPKTRETRAVYEQVVHLVQKHLGDVSTEVLLDCTDEILALLKNDELTLAQRRQELDSLLGVQATKLSAESFNQVVVWSQLLTDYEESAPQRGPQEEHVVQEIAIDLDESDAEDEAPVMEVVEDEEREKRAVEAPESIDGRSQKSEEELAESIAAPPRSELQMTDLEPNWMRKQLQKADFQGSADQVLQTENKILNIIGNGELQPRDCEKKLILLLTPKRIELIKSLVKHRYVIFFGMLLAQAGSEGERQQIEEQMKKIPEGRQLLLELKIENAQAQNKDLLSRADEQIARALRGEDISKDGKVRDSQIRDFSQMKVIDLDELKFQDGPRLMANKKCVLPKGSTRLTKQGYEEVYVPAPRQKKTQGEKLIPIAAMPEWARSAFPSYMTHLNRIQSALYTAAFTTPDNLLVCAPTGAGKTNIAMLACLQLLNEMKTTSANEKINFNLSKFKIVYIAPMKALVSEVVGNFQARLASYGIKVRELTGDVHLSRQQIEETNMIVTTPEKWDIITRKSGERAYVELVKLVIIDEVHLLHDSRGPVLESIVARTIRHIEETSELVRIVGLSATLPNYQDVAALLRVDPDSGLFFFDASCRPVPLEQVFVGITEKKAIKRMMLMNEICYEKVMERVEKHQVIIFTHSRKETARTAKIIRDMALAQEKLGALVNENSESKKILLEVIVEKKLAVSKDLQDLVPYGIGIHHAGLSKDDRTLVEDLFAAGHIKVLVSTATLAWGVNLPAHTVIIKGTQIYSPEQGRWVELSPQDILQMMGRAGRPQFDTLGEGIIITSYSDLQYYLSLNNQQLPIESQMMSALPDQLNAEVVLGSVSNIKEAVNWLSYTYLYIRMRRNPDLYGVEPDVFANDPSLIQMRMNLVHTAALKLQKAGMLKYDRKSGLLLSTSIGKVASHFYIKCDSMQVYNDELKPHMGTIDIFRLFALSKEFENIPIRENEKVELQKFIERVPVPVKGSMEESATKINILLQAYIARFKLDGFDLNADMVYVTQSGSRLMRALFEIALKKGWATLADNLLNCCKMVEKRQWYSMTPLRQFANVLALNSDAGVVKDLYEVARRIERKEQFKWVDFYEFSAQKLGELVKYPKMGKVILDYVHRFPRLEISAFIQPITRSTIKIDIELKTHEKFQWDIRYHGTAEPFWVFVQDCDGEQILHSEQFVLRADQVGQEHHLSMHVPLFDPLPPQYFIKVTSDRWLQAEHVVAVSFKDLILPDKFPAPSQLLEQEPRRIEDLDFEEGQKVYSDDRMREFSPIQSQCFGLLYTTDKSAFLGVPAGGTERRILAELAVLREVQAENFGKIVYISAKPELCEIRFQNWKRRLGDAGLGLHVEMLAGDTSLQASDDLQKVQRADLIVATPAKWNYLSRNPRSGPLVSAVGLYIFDDVHLVGDPQLGSDYEVVMSRARQAQAEPVESRKDDNNGQEAKSRVRIVCMGSPVANSKDICDWMGISESDSLNFHPSARAQCPSIGPLHLNIMGIDQMTRKHRLLQMGKPTYNLLKRHLGARWRGLIFTPDAQQAKKAALDLLTFSQCDDNETLYRPSCSEQEQADFASQVQSAFPADSEHQELLCSGIACLKPGLEASQFDFIKAMFRKGQLRIIVATNQDCWRLSDEQAEIVIVQDPERYSAQARKHVEISVSDISQIMSLCSASGPKAVARCVIMCLSSKKDFISKFVQEPCPVESAFAGSIQDHVAAEVASGTIESIQDAMDWMTWTFLYRRILKNPNYYEISGRTPQHINDFLSELIEDTVQDLSESGCVVVAENEVDLQATNLAQIQVFYNLKYQTTTTLSSMLVSGSLKLKGLLEVLCQAQELALILDGHHGDEGVLRQLALNLPFDLTEDCDYSDSHVKANILLQCHFNRKMLPTGLRAIKMQLVSKAVTLVHAMADIISSTGGSEKGGRLKQLIVCMELSQMLVQASWTNVSPLLQLPFLTKAMIDRLHNSGVEDIADFMNMEDEDRAKLVPLPEDQMQQLAEVCNRYPNLELQLPGLEKGVKQLKVGETTFQIDVVLKRDIDEQDFETKEEFLAELSAFKTPVPTLDFPESKQESWWLVVGHPASQAVLSIKKVTTMHLHAKIQQTLTAQLDPEVCLKQEEAIQGKNPQAIKLKVYLICDSFIGADLEKEFSLKIV